MRPLAVALAVIMLAATAAANAQIYQWKDENGRTVLSDTPPVGHVRQQRIIAAESSAEAASSSPQKSLAERDLEFRLRQKEARGKREQAEKEQANAMGKARYCENVRRQLRAYESGERIMMRDDKGERYFIDDAQREQEIANLRRSMQTKCTP